MHIIKQDQSKVHNMDLLWRYYEKNRNFGKAAHVLARLADMHRSEQNRRKVLPVFSFFTSSSFVTIIIIIFFLLSLGCSSTEISLKQRLEYIARAILSAKSSSCISAQASDGEFLHELEEKMEVRQPDWQPRGVLTWDYFRHFFNVCMFPLSSSLSAFNCRSRKPWSGSTPVIPQRKTPSHNWTLSLWTLQRYLQTSEK